MIRACANQNWMRNFLMCRSLDSGCSAEIASDFYEAKEPASQFANPFRLPQLDGGPGDQFAADPQRGGTRENKSGGGALVYAAGSD
jgi:hypothetical protein